MRRAKQIKQNLAYGLVLVLLFSMLPQISPTAYAADASDAGSNGDISESNVFDALGIDTSLKPSPTVITSPGSCSFTPLKLTALMFPWSATWSKT